MSASEALHVAFGPVVVRIAARPGMADVRAVLARWLAAGVCEAGRPPDVDVELVSAGEGAAAADGRRLVVGPGQLDANRLSVWDGRAWEASVALAPESHGARSWRLRARSGRMLRIADRIPAWLFRLVHHHYFAPHEIRASTFVYRHLIPIVEVELLRRGATFVHASALRHRDGGGVLIAGWGGSGKTSASAWLYLTRPDEWQFLGDDLSIVDRAGQLHYSPLALNVFPYNTARFGALRERVLDGMGGLERAHWEIRRRLLGSGGVVRRLPPFGGRPAIARCPLALALHLQRSDDAEPRVEPAAPAEIARIAAAVLTYELRQSLPAFAAANAFRLEGTRPLPSMEELAREAEGILREGLARSRTLGVDVPEAYEVGTLGETVASLGSSEPGA